MAVCILCFEKTTKSRSFKLSETVSESLTLSDVIHQQLTCADTILSSKPPGQRLVCSACFKSFKSFYEFVAEITQRHPEIKQEQPDDLNNEIFIESLDPNPPSPSLLPPSPRTIKVEPIEPEKDQKFDDDSDFEWDNGGDSAQHSDENPEQPTADKRKYVPYLKESLRTPELLASGQSFVTIDGVEYRIPSTQLDSDVRDERVRKFIDVRCELCDVQQPTFLRLVKHFRREHAGTKPFIRCCGKMFYKRGRLLDHLDRHDTDVRHECRACNKTYKTAYTLKSHVAKMHEKAYEELVCSVCGRTLKGAGALKQHMYTHEEDDERTFECYMCKKTTFKNAHMLRAHIRSKHNRALLATVTCDICSLEMRVSKLREHMKKHTAAWLEKEQCTICDHWIIKCRMHLHRKNHMMEGVACKLCGKMLKSNGSLYSHMKHVHGNDRPFRCDICDKAFIREIKLREHIAVQHTREYLFKCRVCGKQFRAEANWRMHEKRQHPVEYEKVFKPFYKRNPNEEVEQVDWLL